MFERYVEKSRRVIFFARYEASQSGSQWIETHHLLLALFRESWDAFAPFLQSRDRISEIRKEIEQRFPQKVPKVPVSVDLPLSHQSKRALAYGAEESERLGHAAIEPVHLVLGLLREPGVVSEILAPYGMSLEAVRAAAASTPAGSGVRTQRGGGMFERYSEKSRRVIFFARREASEFGCKQIEAHHILLGLLRESWEAFAPFLKSPDEATAIRQEVETRFPRQAAIQNPVDLPLSHESKRVLAYAAEEAERMRSRSIGPRHLLLGLVREQGCTAADILRRHGLQLEAVRKAEADPVEQLLEAETENEALGAAVLGLPADRRDAAWRIVAALGHEKVRIEVTSPEDSFTVSFDTMTPAE